MIDDDLPSGAKRCRHCKRPIMRVNYALGPQWMHGGGSHHDQWPVDGEGVVSMCQIATTAEPEDENPPSLRQLVERGAGQDETPLDVLRRAQTPRSPR